MQLSISLRRGRTLQEHETLHRRRVVEETLKRTGGEIVRAAIELGISRVTLWRIMRDLGIDKARAA